MSSRLTVDEVLSGSRARLYDLIASEPGVCFIDIARRLAWAHGQTQYHLWVLQREGFIQVVRWGRYVRYFATGQQGQRRQILEAARRDPATAPILEALQATPRPTPRGLAARLCVSRQAVAYHLQRLAAIDALQAATTAVPVANGRLAGAPRSGGE
ncbi:MAG: helix-turn-helix domain-containing protein [Euryarchaeota archaeon]|nr:helix-turn-helix domain-containing protein [Euryarchaeota archaeon]